MSEATIDVLIITALKDELDALHDVTRGELKWTESERPPYFTTILNGREEPIRIAATWLPKMGPMAAVAWTEDFVRLLRPQVLAMCGVCAGHPEDTTIGDVTIAERVFEHDEGKRTEQGFQGDLWVRELGEDWTSAAQRLGGLASDFPFYGEASEEMGRWWFLQQLLARREPLKSTALSRYLGERRAVTLKALEEEGLIQFDDDDRYILTKAGRSTIRHHLVRHGTAAAELPCYIHVAPIGSGSAVEAHPAIWGRIKNSGMRFAMGDMGCRTPGAG